MPTMESLREASANSEALVITRDPMSKQFATKLPARALWYEGVRSVVIAAAVALSFALATQLIPDSDVRAAIVFGGLALVLCGTVLDLAVVDRLRVASTSYGVSSETVAIARGVMVRTITVIPARQIMNVQVVHGPLLRHLGLVQVRFTTIAGSPTLGPVRPEEADAIRARILLSSRVDREHD